MAIAPIRSLLPLTVKYGVATEVEIDIETFEARFCDDVLGWGSVVRSLACVGAWVRKG